jgi:bifunctional ADP-heptose synthase (sugar kinase/adenylyltransferase)
MLAGAAAVLAHLVALGVADVFPVGFAGEDGEGFNLQRRIADLVGDRAAGLFAVPSRRTWTTFEPSILETEGLRLLCRLESRDTTPTPDDVCERLGDRLISLAPYLHAIVVCDRSTMAETGVVTRRMVQTLAELAWGYPHLAIVATSRRGFDYFPPACWLYNQAEFGRLLGRSDQLDSDEVRQHATELALERRKPVIAMLAAEGIVAAEMDGKVTHVSTATAENANLRDAVAATLAVSFAVDAALDEAIAAAVMLASRQCSHRFDA